jgi:cell division protein FtsZ
MMGTGEAEGEDRALRAADMAISNPLLDDVTMKGAKGVLINITGGPDLMLFEVEQAANRIRAEVDPDANIIFGNTILEEMEGRIRVSVVATGIDAEMMKLPEKVHTLRPHLKTLAFRIEPVKPIINPVQAQVESLAAELNAAPIASLDDAYALGGKDAPAIPEPAASVRYPATESYRPLEQQPLAHRPQAEKKAGWSLFGRKKAAVPDMRSEPLAAEQRPRANATPMQRPVAQDPVAAQPPGDDLFPDHGTDEQFEIPAFLRRQSN